MSKFGTVFLLLLLAAVLRAALIPSTHKAANPASRAAANERLTAVSGALIFVLLVGIGVTVLLIGPLLPVHYLVGFALIPPLGLKLYTTGSRFVRYYLRDRDFRLAGAPPLLSRFVVAPVLVASTVAVMGTGLELWAVADRFGTLWLSLHTVSAVVFMGAIFVHLLSHLRQSAVAVADDAKTRPPEGAITRRSVLLACAILAVALAAASLTYTTPFGSAVGAGIEPAPISLF